MFGKAETNRIGGGAQGYLRDNFEKYSRQNGNPEKYHRQQGH